jgi:hypothetical protein
MRPCSALVGSGSRSGPGTPAYLIEERSRRDSDQSEMRGCGVRLASRRPGVQKGEDCIEAATGRQRESKAG